MTTKHILQQRLHNQQITATSFKTPEDVVYWMGAMQAQDYAGAKWSVGLRLPGTTDEGIDNAVNKGKIIRTWTQRGTLHFVAPEDVRWLLDLQSERMLRLYTAVLRNVGLDTTLLKKCMKVLTKALEGSNGLTRLEIKALLEQNKITTKDRVYYILVYASLQQLICHGPRKGKEFTFVLMDDWVPAHKKLKNEEAIIKLAERYFTSRGPATIKDFAWWTGWTIKEAAVAIDMLGNKLQEEIVNGVTYFLVNSDSIKKNGIYLLPGFDEYMLAYKDRSFALADEHSKKVIGAPNGLFAATVVINGDVVGVWRRTIEKKQVLIEISAFDKLSAANKKGIERAAKKFTSFLEQPFELKFL